MRFFILINIFFLTTSFQTDTQPQYLRIRLNKNMTIDDLLRIYKLNEFPCNTDLFFKINKTSKTTPLSIGKEYNLPILIFEYNGKSIRSSLGMTDLDAAKAIQSYNLDLYSQNIRKQTYQQSGFLYVPHHITNCRNERKKTTKPISPTDDVVSSKKNEDNDLSEGERQNVNVKTNRVAIFGRNYQDVPIVSKRLKNRIFYVEGGHGGPDPGAQTKVNGRTLSEDEYAYDISLRVARELVKHGATVHIINRDPNDGIRDGEFLISDSDEMTYPNLRVPYNHKARLFQRSDAINKLYEDYERRGITDQRLIVIHVDSRGKKEQTDTFLYYQSGNEASQKLARRMLNTLEAKYARFRDFNGTLSTRDLHMLRETKPTTVFVEVGNIRNEFDRKRIMLAKNRQYLAEWLAEGFMK